LEKVNRRYERENERYESIIKKLTRIETLLENYKDTQIKAEEAHSMSMQNREEIKEINDKMTWISRTIAGTIIGIVIAAIVFVIKTM
jgi:hypothetical protein